MTLKETVSDLLHALLDEVEEDEDEMDAEDLKALVKEKIEEIIKLVDDE